RGQDVERLAGERLAGERLTERRLDFLTLRAQRFSRSLIQVRLRLPKFLFEFSARIHVDTRHT
ncbi:MAG: hypothetical protein VB858_14860, partial [Planctomycetaceae bacterium]